MTDEEGGEDPALPVIAVADRDNRRPHCRVIEAVLFASPAPVSSVDLARRLPEGVDLRAVLDDLIADYAARGVNLTRIGDAWAFRTAEDLADSLQIEVAVPRKLSRAAVETMAIIAYHQPI
ncbi:MAG: SMC-Scp complex subunit ScpB, partial [Pseudomonadota bacterium]|nr:SMC-Scp complex subunit ScpB [Pseudomonadota bacterium]